MHRVIEIFGCHKCRGDFLVWPKGSLLFLTWIPSMCLACMSAYQNWVGEAKGRSPEHPFHWLFFPHLVSLLQFHLYLLVNSLPEFVWNFSSALWCWLTLAKAPGSQECLLQLTVQAIWQVAALGTIPTNTHLITLSQWVCVTFWAIRRAHWPCPPWWKVVTERIRGHTLESLYSRNILASPSAFLVCFNWKWIFPHRLYSDHGFPTLISSQILPTSSPPNATPYSSL